MFNEKKLLIFKYGSMKKIINISIFQYHNNGYIKFDLFVKLKFLFVTFYTLYVKKICMCKLTEFK